MIQEYGLGDYQILVQLPGVDDPARVKEVMQSTAMLEIRQALDNGRPYNSEQEVLAAHNGVLPPDSVIMKGKSIGSQAARASDVYYLISRVSAVSGRDLRSAEAGTEESGRPDVTFTLTRDGGDRFYQFTSQHVGELAGRRARRQGAGGGQHQGSHPRHRPHLRLLHRPADQGSRP